MRALILLLAAAVLAACSSPPVTVDLPPTVHRGTAESAAGQPTSIAGMANEGHCWFLRDDPHARERHRGATGHPHGSSGSRGPAAPRPHPKPTNPPRTTPSPPAPSIAVPTSATTCHSSSNRY